RAARRTGGWSCTSCRKARRTDAQTHRRTGANRLSGGGRPDTPSRSLPCVRASARLVVYFSSPRSATSRAMDIRWSLLLFTAFPLAAQSSPHPSQATDYYRLTSVGEPRPAPDGRRIAVVVTTVVEDKDRRHSEIWMAAADGSSPA